MKIDDPRSTHPALGSHIKQLRASRGLTLQEVADVSGTSRATLSRIENGEVSPTAETLNGLAAALNVPISRMVMPLEKPFQAKVTHEEQFVWNDGRKFVRRSVSPPTAQLSCEVLDCEIAPAQKIEYPKPPLAGLEHHLIMLAGSLLVTVDDAEYQLRTGDSLRYKLFGASSFQTGSEGARYLLVLA